MCNECHTIEVKFNAATKDTHKSYVPLLNFLQSLEEQNRIELFAGDCLLGEAIEVLYEEKHYTVCHYLKCTYCGQIFFFGACIRGTPIYRVVDNIANENLSNRIWGNVGTKYYNTAK